MSKSKAFLCLLILLIYFKSKAEVNINLWVDSTFYSLSTKDKLGELLWVKPNSKVLEQSPVYVGAILTSSHEPDQEYNLKSNFKVGTFDPTKQIPHLIPSLDTELIRSITNPRLLNDYGRRAMSYLHGEVGLSAIMSQVPSSEKQRWQPFYREIYQGIYPLTEGKMKVRYQHELLLELEDETAFIKRLKRGKLKVKDLILAKDPYKEPVATYFEKGADLFEISEDSLNVFLERLEEYYTQNKKSARIINAKVKKALRLKYLALSNATTEVISPPALNEGLEFAYKAAGITVLNNRDIPVSDIFDKKIALFSRDLTFGNYLDRYKIALTTDDIVEFEGLVKYADILIVKYHSSMDLAKLKSMGTNKQLIFMVSKELNALSNFDTTDNIIWSFDDSKDTEDLMTQVLFGARSSSGILPISAKHFKQGAGDKTIDLGRLAYDYPRSVNLDSKKLEKIDSLIELAVGTRATPGGQILVVKDRKVVYDRPFGFQTYDSLFKVNNYTLYDLASVTKVLSTTLQVMKMYENDQLELHDSIGKFIPGILETDKSKITINELLLHQAGLKSYQPFWKKLIDEENASQNYLASMKTVGAIPVHDDLFAKGYLRDSLYQWLVKSPLREKKQDNGTYEYSYSDLGFMLLGQIIESNYESSLDVLSNRFFYAPLGMSSTYFQPWKYYSLEDIAPTEVDKPFRGGLIKGWVHDRNASLLGGISGHAGLFSNANDLAKVLQMLLNGGSYGGHNFFETETVDLFTCQQGEDNRRGLGWDKTGHFVKLNNTSKYGSPEAYGHTGFTGTAIWVDPSNDLIYIFLSNRVYPEATNVKLQELNIRTKIHDLVYEAIID